MLAVRGWRKDLNRSPKDLRRKPGTRAPSSRGEMLLRGCSKWLGGSANWRAAGENWWSARWQIETLQNLFDRIRRMEVGEYSHTSSAAGTFLHIESPGTVFILHLLQ